MPKVAVHAHNIVNACIMTVQAGTNCPQGGDSGHGGRTVFRIFDDASTNLRVRVNDEDEIEASSIQITLGGDAEAQCFVEALEFAARIIRGQFGVNTSEGKDEDIE